jgi:hypothetical protein
MMKLTPTRGRRGLWVIALLSLAWGGEAFVLASPAPASFGVERFENSITADEGGSSATQAGSHPYAMTTTIVFNNHESAEAKAHAGSGIVPDGDPKNVKVDLPEGMIVNPSATTERCTEAELVGSACPDSSAVGELIYRSNALAEGRSPVFNMVPPPGIAADLGANPEGFDALIHILGSLAPIDGSYTLSGEILDITQKVGLDSSTLTLWGDPSAESHDRERGQCSTEIGREKVGREEVEREREIEEKGIAERSYFCTVKRSGERLLTMPSSCTESLLTTINAESWQGSFAEASVIDKGSPFRVTGCEKLRFDPSLVVQPDTSAAGSPSGLNVDLSVPQEESPTGLAESNLRDAVVTLPAGMVVNPSAASGLDACAESQIALASYEPATCPDASKVGAVEVLTPLLDHPLEGSVYLAQQGRSVDGEQAPGSNPFGSLIALYVVIEGSGLVIKLAGEVRLDPITGQVTTTFKENPEVPFSELRLHLFGGPRASLVTPSACGMYTTTSSLTPWSAPESGPSTTPGSRFEINQDCHGAQFSPSFVAGTQNNQAGGFSPFALTLSREDSEEDFGRIQVQIPPGLLGMVSSIPLCEGPQVALGTCGPSSLIGHVMAAVGAGPDPFYIRGQVFLTGPYKGAPYGLLIVVPAVAGPFNLGLVKVRAAVNVDPHTAALTVTSDPLPQVIEGIPIQVRKINVSIDREHFIFNPTSCNPMSIGATLTSTLGAGTQASSRYQAANCAALGFHPRFKASTSGRTSRKAGASLDTRLTLPPEWQANIAQVKVELPRQLPSRLKTLQKACLARVFEANPASCPPASVVGIAKATTPVLSGALTGPVYFVSYGGEAFPNVVVILQGNGVRVDLVGSTFISKAQVTSTTFKTVPDVPASSFELYLPQGPDSAFAANGNLCKSSLVMPTMFTAQNGAVFKQNTKIAVNGCPKAKKTKKASHSAHTRSRR